MIIKRMEYEDLPYIKEIRNKHKFCLRQWKDLNNADQKNWFETTLDLYYSIFKENETKDLCGAVGLTYIDWISRKAEISLITENYINVYALEASKFILKYGFAELGLHKIYSEVYQFDYSKVTLWTEMGFKFDCTIRDNYYHDNGFWDSYIYSMLREEYYNDKIQNNKTGT